MCDNRILISSSTVQSYFGTVSQSLNIWVHSSVLHCECITASLGNSSELVGCTSVCTMSGFIDRCILHRKLVVANVHVHQHGRLGNVCCVCDRQTSLLHISRPRPCLSVRQRGGRKIPLTSAILVETICRTLSVLWTAIYRPGFAQLKLERLSAFPTLLCLILYYDSARYCMF